MLYSDTSLSGSLPARLSSRVSRVVWLLKTSSRWNLRKRKMVTKMTISRMTAAKMTSNVIIMLKFPLPNLLMKTPMEQRKAMKVMRVIRMV